MLKQHWARSRQEIACPVTVLGSYQKPQEDQGGLICMLDETGSPQAMMELPMPAGMVRSDDGVFVASLSAVHEVAADLSSVRQDAVSLPMFNMLHSLSRTRQGYLVASTGIDALVEFKPDGQLLWSWWAVQHGFEFTPTGEQRVLDVSVDHRSTRYGTLTQTTHVNSAAELPDGRILASLFHQGTVIAIDRESGNWQTVVEGLDHPHAVRVLDEQHFTVADTARGRALLIRMEHGQGKVATEVSVDTDWLQDAQYDEQHNSWLLVDGKHSRLILRGGLKGRETLAQFDLHPEWRLYETLVV
jgi:hypothetical protein